MDNTQRLIRKHVDRALYILEHTTTDEFSKGGDREARESLAAALWLSGHEDGDLYAAYADAIDQAVLELNGLIARSAV